MKPIQRLITFGYRVVLGSSLLVWPASGPAGTVAYWRFEQGPAGKRVAHLSGQDGVWSADIADSSGNGNALSVWTEAASSGYTYRTNTPSDNVAPSAAPDCMSVQNSGAYPCMWNNTLENWAPAAFTIEVVFNPEDGQYRTLVGRDSYGAGGTDPKMAALYLQLQPGNAAAIMFQDVMGYQYSAVSAAGVVAAGRWYALAAVSDGQMLTLYLRDLTAGTRYRILTQTDLTAQHSPNTALTPGVGSGSSWMAGDFSVGRGFYNGGHTDRVGGFIDEVRLSDVALKPSEFLFTDGVYIVAGPTPTNQAVVLGDSASFSVKAGGLDNGFQWRHEGVILPGATGSSYTIAATRLVDAGSYDVVVTNWYTSVTSSQARLSVVRLVLSADTTPPAETRYPGQEAIFQAVFRSDQPTSYQWESSKDGGGTFANVPSATGTNLVLGKLQLGDAGLYRLRAWNTFATNTSTPARLQVLTEPTTTVAYWRFENDGTNTPAPFSMVEDSEGRAKIDTGRGVRGIDVSGNGNTVWAWNASDAGARYETNVPAAAIPVSGADNFLAVGPGGDWPGLFTWSTKSHPAGADIETITPTAWTLEASICPTVLDGTDHTFVGRDGNHVALSDDRIPPLCFQVSGGSNENSLRICFVDLAGLVHEVVDQAPLATNYWFNVAAVSDGTKLSLYKDSGDGYVLAGSSVLNSTAPGLTVPARPYERQTDGSTWSWTIGRGRFGTNLDATMDHTHRFFGYIDEVRLSSVALRPAAFLFARRPVLSVAGWPTNGLFQLRLDGAPGVSYILQANTNLVGGQWVPVFTNLAPFTFTESNVAKSPRRFYRAVGAD